MQKYIAIMFLVLFSLSGLAIASEKADGDMAANDQAAIDSCKDAAADANVQDAEMNAYIESCVQQMASGQPDKGPNEAD